MMKDETSAHIYENSLKINHSRFKHTAPAMKMEQSTKKNENCIKKTSMFSPTTTLPVEQKPGTQHIQNKVVFH